mmetsp:Transcript_27511/g.64904  ORF Transcript_27511/g.64904 Transcript_27511/m.64904 type:complete len:220 (-) Transcript_27511:192-851(-)
MVRRVSVHDCTNDAEWGRYEHLVETASKPVVSKRFQFRQMLADRSQHSRKQAEFRRSRSPETSAPHVFEKRKGPPRQKPNDRTIYDDWHRSDWVQEKKFHVRRTDVSSRSGIRLRYGATADRRPGDEYPRFARLSRSGAASAGQSPFGLDEYPKAEIRILDAEDRGLPPNIILPWKHHFTSAPLQVDPKTLKVSRVSWNARRGQTQRGQDSSICFAVTN